MSKQTVGMGLMASGRGSNAEALLRATKEGRIDARGTVIVSNHPDAGVHDVAREFGIPSETIRRDQFQSGKAFAEALLHCFQSYNTDLICLAGYMRKVPPMLLRAFPNAVLNIHPALLPRHGGKGMYGHFVHKAVVAEGDKETGVTIHYVDPEYDRGPILHQVGGVAVAPGDTPEEVAARVLKVEHRSYAEAVAKWIEKNR